MCELSQAKQTTRVIFFTWKRLSAILSSNQRPLSVVVAKLNHTVSCARQEREEVDFATGSTPQTATQRTLVQPTIIRQCSYLFSICGRAGGNDVVYCRCNVREFVSRITEHHQRLSILSTAGQLFFQVDLFRCRFKINKLPKSSIQFQFYQSQ